MTGPARPADFWSRRRATVRAEAEAEQAVLRAEEAEAREAESAERSDEEILAELGLPDPDTMEEGRRLRSVPEVNRPGSSAPQGAAAAVGARTRFWPISTG